MQYSYPIVRHLDWTLMALDVIDIDYNIAGIGVPGDSLRVMRGGMTTVFRDGWKGAWGAAALASVDLDLAGAETANRFSAAPSFFKLNLALERAQPIGKSFTFVARAVGQITSGTVPAAEVFTYGGREFGRAFNLSESFGDRGAAVSAELRYAIDWIDFLKDKADPQLYVFADHGWLSSDDPRNAPLFTQASSAGGRGACRSGSGRSSDRSGVAADRVEAPGGAGQRRAADLVVVHRAALRGGDWRRSLAAARRNGERQQEDEAFHAARCCWAASCMMVTRQWMRCSSIG
jgi:hypothetical protein